MLLFSFSLVCLPHSPTVNFRCVATAFASYLVGKVNPKINSLLLSKLPANTLAQTNNFLSFYSPCHFLSEPFYLAAYLRGTSHSLGLHFLL